MHSGGLTVDYGDAAGQSSATSDDTGLTGGEALLSLLACPGCHGELVTVESALMCTTCSARYPIVRGTPRLIWAEDQDGGERSSSGWVARLTGKPGAYEALQRLLGSRRTLGHVRDALGETRGFVLDVGGGTGAYSEALPAETTYVWLDTDLVKLAGLRARLPGALAVLGDAARLPFRASSVDDVLCIAVAHHLSDPAFERMAAEVARVARRRVLLLEPLRSPTGLRGRFLWRLDRGAYPRTASELVSVLGRHLEEERSETYTIHHRYLLWIGRPRTPGSV